ncbi:hypothetical protein [Spirosoma pomorum]
MKAVPILLALVGLLSCRPDLVNPENITQIEYYMGGGFAGVSYKITLNDAEQRFQARQCDKTISYGDWRTLLTDFNTAEYKSLPEKAEQECCDQFFYSLDITTEKNTYHREWSTFMVVGDRKLPQSISQLAETLSDRAWVEAQACR